MGTSRNRKETIQHLELLAQEVLKLKNQHRQRRPIVIEFCGSPKAGKTSSITSLNIFLKRNGFKTSVLSERASICPISDKQSPTFNVWTCSSTINEINEKMDAANLTGENQLDIIICDRGIFDALCWFRWLKEKRNMNAEEYKVLTSFATLYRWQKNIDLVYVFMTTPEESIKREYANLLTDKRGSIMRETVLDEYKSAIQETLKEYRSTFRATQVIDTTNQNQNDVGYEVTEQTLLTLKEMLMEKIGFVAKDEISISPGIQSFSLVKEGLEHIKYESRELVEKNDNYIQPIAIAIIISRDKQKILCVKKNSRSTKSTSPEFGQTLIYVGGHMRKEDQSIKCKCFLDILKNTLERELFEELGVSIVIENANEPFVVYVPDSTISQNHLAIGWVIEMDEHTKFRLDSYELVQKRGTTKSGSFISMQDIVQNNYSLESWSRTMLLELFGSYFTKDQKNRLENMSEQLFLF